MASASAGASTPFITSTPNSAVTFVFPVAGVRFGEGLGFAGIAAGSAALVALVVVAAELLFASAASFVPAKTGAADTAASNKLQNHFFRFIKHVLLLIREPFFEFQAQRSLARGLGLHLVPIC